jgi:Protein of unknown function (DUF3048) N-terminal domain/Protein of unknown function (DUF3048) C-terminal domain
VRKVELAHRATQLLLAPRRPSRDRAPVACAAAAFAVLGLSGCVTTVASPVSPSDQHGSTRASPVPRASAVARASATAIAPLTGLPTSQATAARPAVAVAVAGSQLRGLSSADVVFEEITTPMQARYIAVFQSSAADDVGPVTSTRPTDGMVLSVLHPLLGYDGGTTGFVALLHQSRVIDFGYAGQPVLYKTSAAGVTASPIAFWLAGDKLDSAPPELYQYRSAGPNGVTQLATGGVRRIGTVRLSIPGAPTQVWQFSAGTDRWIQTAGGPRVAVSNLIIQTAAYKTVYLSRRYGVTAASARTVGSGPVLVVTGAADTTASGRGGLAAVGTWHRPGMNALTSYVDARDLPMALQPGPTWVIFAPSDSRVQTA